MAFHGGVSPTMRPIRQPAAQAADELSRYVKKYG